MSSDAVRPSPNTAFLRGLAKAGLGLSLAFGAPLVAQDDVAVTQAQESAPGDGGEEAASSPEPRRQFDRIDLTITRPSSQSDALLEQDCDEENEAARIRGEIVVCRQLGEATDGYYDREEWQKRYAEETALKDAPRAPDFIADCKDQGMPFGCVTLGGVPEAALMIDVGALPQAPEGSDADRIAKGLPPLGKDPGPSAEEIAARRRALGLDAPPVPEE